MAEPESALAASSRQCLACRQLIHATATTCQHCGAAQQRNRWAELGVALRWIAGATAIMSLVLLSTQVTELVSSWQRRDDAIAELIRTAKAEAEFGFYELAWQSIDRALELDAASESARYAQVELAQELVRANAISYDKGSWVDDVRTALFRGSVAEQPMRSADALAHLGRLELLAARGAFKIAEQSISLYRSALERAPNSVYAHMMLRDALIDFRCRGNGAGCLEEAAQHLAQAKAHASADLLPWVERWSLHVLAASSIPEVRVEGLRQARAALQRDPDRELPERLRLLAFMSYVRLEHDSVQENQRNFAALTGAFSYDELWEIFQLLRGDERIAERGSYELRLARAVLLDNTGQRELTLAAYRSMASDATLGTHRQEMLRAEVVRLEEPAAAVPRMGP
jgi:hypothetical protein